MTCRFCDIIENDSEHESMLHEVILGWERYWSGRLGWQRKQAITQAKRDARAIVKKKKPVT